MGRQAPTIIPGTRYGHLELTGVYIPGYMERNKKIYGSVECKCDCGSITYKQLSNLENNNLQICSNKCIYFVDLTHGHRIGKKTTKEYRAWRSMKQKCDYPKHTRYQYYGGKGITYHESFDTFEGFLEIMGFAPSKYHRCIRIDKEGDFEPGNVHWYLADGKKKK